MSRGFLQVKDSELARWSRDFLAQVSADPARWALDPARVAVFAAAQEAYVAAYRAATNPVTRTQSAVAGRKDARAALMDEARRIAKRIEGGVTLTDEERIGLGLPVRKRGTRVGPPTSWPGVRLVSIFGRGVTIQLFDRESTRRGRPVGVAAAELFTWVGPDPSSSVDDWRPAGSTGKTRVTVEFPARLTPEPGCEVWITARWANRRMEAGPTAPPVQAYTLGGLTWDKGLRLAA